MGAAGGMPGVKGCCSGEALLSLGASGLVGGSLLAPAAGDAALLSHGDIVGCGDGC